MVLATSKRQEQVAVEIGQQVKFIDGGMFHFGIVTRVGRKLATVKYGDKKSDFLLTDLTHWNPRNRAIDATQSVTPPTRNVKRAKGHK